MIDLLERLKKATGPDRELDLALATALAPDVLVLRQRDDDSGADPYTHWEYTGSIDDALALVERMLPGWYLILNTNAAATSGSARLMAPLPSAAFSVSERMATAPLAILTALIRALPGTTQP